MGGRENGREEWIWEYERVCEMKKRIVEWKRNSQAR